MGAVKKVQRCEKFPGHTVWGKTLGPVVYVGDVIAGAEHRKGVSVYLDERESNEVRAAWGWPTKEQHDELIARHEELCAYVDALEAELEEVRARTIAVVSVSEVLEQMKPKPKAKVA